MSIFIIIILLICTCIILAALVNLFTDIYYQIYVVWYLTVSKIKMFLEIRKPVLEETIISDICFTNDLDAFLHMNNARYIRQCDFARVNHLTETGLMEVIIACGGQFLAAAHSIRYRKAISFLTRYEIQSKIIYWNNNAFFFEQTFVDKNNGFIYCVNITKMALTGVTIDTVFEKLKIHIDKPPLLPEIAKWIESMELSSARVRKDR